jgi:transcription antitermination factor NusG
VRVRSLPERAGLRSAIGAPVDSERMNQRQAFDVFSLVPIVPRKYGSGRVAETFLTWRYAVLAFPPASDRGSTLPPIEAIRILPHVVKKKWFAVYTAPRHEKFVQAQLVAKQIQSFLPVYSAVRRWKNGVRREIQHPLFPGYVFVCFDANERLPVIQTAGVVYIVGNGSSPLPVDDQEIHALRVGTQHASLSPHPPVSVGDAVCIKRGPFQGVRGHVQRDRGNLTFVVTIQLIQKSFAIGIQACDLELAG